MDETIASGHGCTGSIGPGPWPPVSQTRVPVAWWGTRQGRFFPVFPSSHNSTINTMSQETKPTPQEIETINKHLDALLFMDARKPELLLRRMSCQNGIRKRRRLRHHDGPFAAHQRSEGRCLQFLCE
jgi:hypothetical protein